MGPASLLRTSSLLPAHRLHIVSVVSARPEVPADHPRWEHTPSCAQVRFAQYLRQQHRDEVVDLDVRQMRRLHQGQPHGGCDASSDDDTDLKQYSGRAGTQE